MNKYVLFLVLCMSCVLQVAGEVVSLNGHWKFQRLHSEQSQEAIRNQGTDWNAQYDVEHISRNTLLSVAEDTLRAEMAKLNAGTWEDVVLPHTPYDEPLTVLHQWQGVCYYKRMIEIPREWDGRQLWVQFEGAMQLADIWVNGRHLMQHAGGYTPFVIDLTGFLNSDGPNELLVRLDNRDNALIPPGKPLGKLDFCYYGGLYRNVNLVVKPELHITNPILEDEKAGGGVFVTYPDVAAERSVVQVQTQVANAGNIAKNVRLRQTLYEMDGLFGKAKRGKRVVSDGQEFILEAGGRRTIVQKMVVENPRLWSPDAPNLYLVCTELIEGGRVADQEDTRIGIRHLEMNREKGFVINGQPLRLVGSNRHMEYPYVGNALPDNAQYRDIYQIKNSGFNVVRLGHYPQAASVLDACDELGVLAIEPIPGWQFFNKAPLFTELTYRDIRLMIRRDRNHPSVIMWEVILNESWPPAAWKDGAVRAAHEEYPGDQCFTSGDTYGYEGYDVSYNDWEEGFKRPNTSKNPGFIREYYDFEFGGHYSTTRIRRGDGEKALLQNAWNAQWSNNRYRAYYPWTMGDAVWSMYDYNRGCADNICYSGVADLFRLPKFSLDFFRNQLCPGTPLPGGNMPSSVFIANGWTPRAPSNDTVIVFGNVDEVELWVNGKMVKKQKADAGPDTDYVGFADGGNSGNLAYPPFTFTGVKWEPGELKAVGFRSGVKVAEQRVKTPGQPQRLSIRYFESGKPAARRDLLIVHVSILDQEGTLCLNENFPVNLTVEGGRIRGAQTYDAEAGIASFLVETYADRVLKLTAHAGSMEVSKKIRLRLY